MAMVSNAGWRVERVLVQGELVVEERLRVSWRGYWQADCADTTEVARYVDPATLVPDRWVPPSLRDPVVPEPR